MTATTLLPTSAVLASAREGNDAPADLERRYGAANYHPLDVTLGLTRDAYRRAGRAARGLPHPRHPGRAVGRALTRHRSSRPG